MGVKSSSLSDTSTCSFHSLVPRARGEQIPALPQTALPIFSKKNVDPGWFLGYPHEAGRIVGCIF
jgi:hypothetical protein